MTGASLFPDRDDWEMTHSSHVQPPTAPLFAYPTHVLLRSPHIDDHPGYGIDRRVQERPPALQHGSRSRHYCPDVRSRRLLDATVDEVSELQYVYWEHVWGGTSKRCD